VKHEREREKGRCADVMGCLYDNEFVKAQLKGVDVL
jgi:hypothetical protein